MPDKFKLEPDVHTACWHGTIRDKSVRELIEEAKTDATIIWCEPVNGRDRVQHLTTLAKAEEWKAPPDVDLAEGRVFFTGGLLHLLADASGTRFAAWAVVKDRNSPPKSPAWCPEPAKGPLFVTCVKRSRGILLVGAKPAPSATTVRRGLSGGLLRDPVQAIEYYEQGILRWWRLAYNDEAK